MTCDSTDVPIWTRATAQNCNFRSLLDPNDHLLNNLKVSDQVIIDYQFPFQHATFCVQSDDQFGDVCQMMMTYIKQQVNTGEAG